MTTQEAIIEAYEDSNEQDDLTPYTAGVFNITSAGAVRWLAAFARAAKVISTWKFADGQRLRFRVLESEDIVASSFLEGETTQSDFPTSTFELGIGSGIDGTDNVLRGRLFTLDATNYLITASDATTVTLNEEVASLTSSSYSIAKRDYGYDALGANGEWALSHRPVEFIGLYDVAGRMQLEEAAFHERFLESLLEAGTPGQFARQGNSLRLNVFPSEVLNYVVRYVRYAEIGTAADDDLCDLPEAFHEALVYWVKNWALTRDGDFTAATKAYQQAVAILKSLRLQADFDTDYSSYRMTQDRS